MGACGSSGSSPVSVDGVPPEVAIKLSRTIDKFLRDEERRMCREVKMLLLGPGSSGKSTILLIHLSGFTSDEVEEFRIQIFKNICDAMRLCLELLETNETNLSEKTLRECENFLQESPFRDEAINLEKGAPYPPHYYVPLRALWIDENVQQCVKGNSAVPENFYTPSTFSRLFNPALLYTPTQQDILRARHQTTGIIETHFQSKDLNYRIFDVGGQRSERKKWIAAFEGVTAIIFLAAISGYDQALLEDPDSNQIQEALMVFDSICNSGYFVRTSIILFLNKVDLFKERILISSLRKYFPDYEGDDTNYNTCREFIKSKFVRLNRSQEKEIYTNYTTAIDTNLVRVVMASVQDIIVSRNLNDIIL